MKACTVLVLAWLMAARAHADVIGSPDHHMELFGKEGHKVQLKTGDLVTVQITEAIGTNTDVSLNDSDQTAVASTNGGGFLGPLPTLNNTGGETHKVENASAQTQTISTTVTVRVTALDANNNAVLDGSKLLLAGNRKVTLSVHGVVRVRDVSPDFTVSSNRMADAQVKVDGLVRRNPIQFVTRILGIIL